MFDMNLKDVPFKEVKISDICIMRNRGSDYYKQSEFVGPHEGAMIIAPPNIIDNRICFDDVSYYSWDGYNKKPDLNIEVGDLLLVKMANQNVPFKSAVVYELPEPAITNSSIHIFKEIQCNPTYLQLIISSDVFQQKLKSSQTNSTILTIKQSSILEMTILLPPREIQDEIASRLVDYREKTEQLVTCLQNEITLRKHQYSLYTDSILWQTNR